MELSLSDVPVIFTVFICTALSPVSRTVRFYNSTTSDTVSAADTALSSVKIAQPSRVSQ